MSVTYQSFKKGAVTGIVVTFPLAAICALVYRFPVPFTGYKSGLLAIIPALIGVFVYGLLGGFLVQALVGGFAGLLAEMYAGAMRKDIRRTRVVFCTIGAAVGVFVLAILDKFIGPW